MADAIPWFFLLAALGFRAFLEDCRTLKPQNVVFLTAAILLLTVSVAMQIPGVFSPASGTWNACTWKGTPRDIDDHPERLWNWRHPQFLAWAQ